MFRSILQGLVSAVTTSSPRGVDWLVRIELAVLVVALCVIAWQMVGHQDPGEPPAGKNAAVGQNERGDGGDASSTSPAPVRSRLLPVDPPEAALPTLHEPSVLVEKAGRRLTVFDHGRAVKRYRVDVGRSPGDKEVEGDMRTPEGTFYICVHNPRSKFTRSLGLSYPDPADAKRGLRSGIITRSEYDAIVAAHRRRAIPPWNTALGGEIMIHGNSRNTPGKKWTAGCIGLVHNQSIHELFENLPNGTLVEIRP